MNAAKCMASSLAENLTHLASLQRADTPNEVGGFHAASESRTKNLQQPI